MKLEIKVPEVGESIKEGILVAWLAEDGAAVAKDQPLFELETDKITMQVVAQGAGQLKTGVTNGSRVDIGQVVGEIDTGVSAGVPTAAKPAAASVEVTAQTASAAAGERDPSAMASSPAHNVASPAAVSAPVLAPSIRRLVREGQIDLAQLDVGGRLGTASKGDVIRLSDPQATAGNGLVGLEPRETRKPLSPMRRRIAERLVQAQHQAAALTTFNEADMTALMELRKEHRDSFQARYGARLGFMSFFVKAAVEALRSVPTFNSRLEGDELVLQHYFDVGVAVSTERGLVVPVLRNADQLSFAAIEQQIADFGERAQSGRLELAELQGGCVTISNGGVFGSLLSTPILNPPQPGIIGLHAIKKRPVAVGEQVAVRPMMYLALSYDHRVADGREAVTFLKRIVECVENPARLLLQI